MNFNIEPLKLSGPVYDVLKSIAQTWLPFVAMIFYGVSKIFTIPYAAEIIGIAVIVDFALGMLLGISSHFFYKEAGDRYLS